MKFAASTFAVFGLASMTNAHALLANPPPYPDQDYSNGPLAADGSNFPCKGSSYTGGTTTTLTPGSSQALGFTGSAVHGGGSCQISITYDAVPNKQSTWKVLHSYISGCPAEGTNENLGENANLNLPYKYPFQIDERLPAGKATLAWTWLNKIGNREFYMNCAPVEIAGSSKRGYLDEDDEFNSTQIAKRDQAYFDSLPNMFVANIQMPSGFPGNTVEGTDVIFPNPGEYVTFGNQGSANEEYNKAADPPADVIAFNGAASGSASAPSATASPESSPSASPAETAAPTVPGGVFITVNPEASSTDAPVASSTAPVSTSPGPVATNQPVAEEPSSTVSSPVAGPTTSPSTGGGSGNGSTTAGSACSVEGEWNCIDGSSFQRCASGVWSAVQQLSAGTECTVGTSDSIAIAAIATKPRRAVRFSHEHFKRHLLSS